MKTTILKNALFLVAISALFSFDIPKGWIVAGNDRKSYEMGIDKSSGQDGKNAATIKSIQKKVKGYGTLMQDCKPDKFLGKRIRLTGYIKSENVKDWAGLWLRVDKAGSEEPLSFDNMFDRKVSGTIGWTKYELVLYVPKSASNLAYGALLSGTGQIWFDNLSIDIVDNTVNTTGSINAPQYEICEEPTNLDFEK